MTTKSESKAAEAKEEAIVTSTSGNVPVEEEGKPPRLADKDRAARYTETKNTREMMPDIVSGERKPRDYKTRG